MSGKVCLFCGKGLSRMRVGGGDDFCSREHRNHYRLRRGMDQLQEANQMSSLMRRRENPKPLVTLVSAGGEISLPRTLPLPSAAHPRCEVTAWKPALIPSFRHKIDPPLDASTFSRLGLPRIAPAEPRRLALKRLSFAGKATGVLSRQAISGSAGLEPCARERTLVSPPSKGAALRVSLPVAFRRPRMLTRGIDVEPQVVVPASRAGHTLPAAAGQIASAPRSLLLETGIFQSQLVRPSPPEPKSIPGIRHPGSIALLHPRWTDCAARIPETGWSLREPVANLVVPVKPAGKMQPRSSEASVFVLANTPSRGERAPRLASVPFLSQDVPFGFAEEEPQKR